MNTSKSWEEKIKASTFSFEKLPEVKSKSNDKYLENTQNRDFNFKSQNNANVKKM